LKYFADLEFYLKTSKINFWINDERYLMKGQTGFVLRKTGAGLCLKVQFRWDPFASKSITDGGSPFS
jgi:hypothetical protein